MEETSLRDPIQPYRRRPVARGDVDQYYDDEEDEDDGYYDSDEEEGEDAGNFWSNPPGRYDPVQSARPKRRVPRPDEPAPARRRPRLSSNERSKGVSRRKKYVLFVAKAR